MSAEQMPAPTKGKTQLSGAGDKAGSPDRRRLRGDASAQRIIDATIELIAEDGINSITMQRIAARVGSSNALVVFHFGSKDNLLVEVLKFLTDQYEALWHGTVRQPDITPEQRVLAATGCAQQFIRQHPGWAAAWIAFSSDRKTMLVDRQISLPNEVGYVAEVQAMIAEIARIGSYTDVDTVTLTQGLNFLVQGAWYWNNSNPSDTTPAVLARATQMLLHAAFPRSFPQPAPQM
jgi:AcrR family transcriptional regulator